MAQIVVRNIPEDVMANLKAAAKAAGKSTEQLAREALADVARKQDVADAWARLEAIRAQSKFSNLDIVAAIRDDRETRR